MVGMNKRALGFLLLAVLLIGGLGFAGSKVRELQAQVRVAAVAR